LLWSVISWLSKTNGLALTLSGAAGIIVSIGVTVDSYVVFFEKLKDDKRVKYLIFQGKIWSKEKAKQGNRKYTGSNAHNKHLHISIVDTGANDVSPWFPWLNQPKIVNQIIARVTPVPAKKAYKTEVCTCCKLHGTKS
jgi:hypothetical protein